MRPKHSFHRNLDMEILVTVTVTKPFTIETLKEAFAKAIAETTMDEPGIDAASRSHYCTLAFDWVLTDFDRAQVRGGLLGYQLEHSDWLDVDITKSEFIEHEPERHAAGTTFEFYINTARLTDAIRAALV